jgi:hypothetical protein
MMMPSRLGSDLIICKTCNSLTVFECSLDPISAVRHFGDATQMRIEWSIQVFVTPFWI